MSNHSTAMTPSYQEFLQRKSQIAGNHGFEPLWFPDCLFPFQRHADDWAIRQGRAALFFGCGLGKTPLFLTWAENVVRHTNRPILVMTQLGDSKQTVKEGEKFGVECVRSRDGRFPSGARVVVTNYEQLEKFNPTDFSGAVANESSILKNFDGKIKATVTEFLRELPYRLLCTATAAPNDYVELGTSSEALGELGYQDMLTRFFTKHLADRGTIGWGREQYRMKGHAESDFWRWVASWARAARKPSDLGDFDDGPFQLPPIDYRNHIVKAQRPAAGFLFNLPAVRMEEEREEMRRTLDERCGWVADLVKHDRPAICWCHLNPEGDMLEKLIPDAVQVSGRDSDEEKEEKIEAFIACQIRVMISKPKIMGYGLNFQHCAHITDFPSHCYDETTELLTKRGWLRFGDISLDDEAATVNPETLAFEWQQPSDVVWSLYDGPMIHFGHKGDYARSFDLLVTPNHRMFVRKCPIRFPSAGGQWEIQTAGFLQENFKRQKYRFLSVPLSFVGNEIDSVHLPEWRCAETVVTGRVNRSGDRRGMITGSMAGLVLRRICPVQDLSADQFLRLAGWYLSEGNCGFRDGVPDGQVRITQTEINAEYRQEIIALFESIPGLRVYSANKDIRVCSKQLALFLMDQFGANSHDKRIPGWVKDLAPKHLVVLRDTMLKGDGCAHKRGGIKKFYRTVSKGLADDFAEICLKTGIRGSVRYRHPSENRFSEFGIWDVNLARETLEPSIQVAPEIVPYSGMIGCVSVPNGLLIVRRNGIPIVSGNSWEQWHQMIRRCWRFGQTQRITVDTVSTEGLEAVQGNRQHKEEKVNRMFDRLVGSMNSAMKIKRSERHTLTTEVPAWLF